MEYRKHHASNEKGAWLMEAWDLGSDIHGNIQRIENALEMLTTRLATCKEAFANVHTQIENAKAEVENRLRRRKNSKQSLPVSQSLTLYSTWITARMTPSTVSRS